MKTRIHKERAQSRAASQFALVFLAFAGTVGCGSSIAWKNYFAARTTGTDLSPSHWGPREVAETAISANLNYVTVSLDKVFFRDLPGLGSADVVFGFEIQGILPGGRAIKTVLGTQRAEGKSAFLSFDNLVVIEPFLYRGETVTLNLNFTAVPGAEAQMIGAQLRGPASDALKRINPHTTMGVDMGVNMFSQVFGLRAKTWQYSFSMFPADRVYRDKPDLLFTATRHILIAIPPVNAPDELKKYRPNRIVAELKMRGNQLVWAKNGEEFTELPYIVLNITRFKRYPKEESELRRALKTVDAHIENGSLELARNMLQTVGALINNDPIITATEKNLERSLVLWREARIGTLQAKKNAKTADELVYLEKEVDHLLFLLGEFHKILEPHETKDFTYRVNDRFRRVEELAKDTRAEVAWLAPSQTKYAKVLKLIEPAPLPTDTVGVAMTPPGDLYGVTPEKPSLLKKWWFWTAIGAGAAALGTTLALIFSTTETTSLGYPVTTVGLPPGRGAR